MLKAQTRGMFLIFVGFMVLGLAEHPNEILVLGCGIVTITTGIVFICLTCKDPDLFTDKPAQKPQEPYVPPNSETHPGAPAKWEPKRGYRPGVFTRVYRSLHGFLQP